MFISKSASPTPYTFDTLVTGMSVSGFHELKTGSLEAESKPWIGATDRLLLANIFSKSNQFVSMSGMIYFVTVAACSNNDKFVREIYSAQRSVKESKLSRGVTLCNPFL